MSDHTCACGYEAASDDELADHIGEMVIPDDDIAMDGVRHAEFAGHAGHRCLCGFVAEAGADLDEHLLTVFTVGRDSGRHEC